MVAPLAILNILVVEDNENLREAIHDALDEAGHHVTAVDSIEATVEHADLAHIDIAILDLNLPGEDGLSFASRLRKTRENIGIIILSARGSSEDKCLGFDLGADVYLAKPVPLRELLAVIRSLSRRLQCETHDRMTLQVRQSVLAGPQSHVTLTVSETALLSAFTRAPQQQLENWQIAELLAMPLDSFNKPALELHIVRLRKKIALAGATGTTIKVVRGWGYRLCLNIKLD